MISMKQRKVKVPYEGYRLPPSSEQGGQFVDFNKVINRKVVRKVKKKGRNGKIQKVQQMQTTLTIFP